MSEKLKPCKCGDEPALRNILWGKARAYYVQCSACLRRTGQYFDEADAIAAWNRRAEKGGEQ